MAKTLQSKTLFYNNTDLQELNAVSARVIRSDALI